MQSAEWIVPPWECNRSLGGKPPNDRFFVCLNSNAMAVKRLLNPVRNDHFNIARWGLYQGFRILCQVDRQ